MLPDWRNLMLKCTRNEKSSCTRQNFVGSGCHVVWLKPRRFEVWNVYPVAAKKLRTVFFNSSGTERRILLDTQMSITAKWYQCLPKVIEFLKSLRPNPRMNFWFFHNIAKLCTDYLTITMLKLLEHLPYSSCKKEDEREAIFQWWWPSEGLG